ncbi:MAG: addiction module toxin RelE [Candidatus ainarchaeum sp.]|nr:addiction module toxin RelE [Candidatus ainarchaeum sp.]
MPFDFDLSNELKEKIQILSKKDRNRLKILKKKMDKIINSDEITIQNYKNLRNNLSDKKRVHIDKSFVLTFSYFKENNFILFVDFDHHDKIYN